MKNTFAHLHSLVCALACSLRPPLLARARGLDADAAAAAVARADAPADPPMGRTAPVPQVPGTHDAVAAMCVSPAASAGDGSGGGSADNILLEDVTVVVP